MISNLIVWIKKYSVVILYLGAAKMVFRKYTRLQQQIRIDMYLHPTGVTIT